MQRFDAAIIGAGPAGAAAAISLARKGYSVALFDKQEFPRPKLCGDFFNPVNWPICGELGMADDLLAEPHDKIYSLRITAPSGAQAVAQISQEPGRISFGLGISRERLDWVLLRAAHRRGVAVFEKRRVKQLVKQSYGWRIDAERDNRVQSVQAKIVIGADGRNSWVANRLGLTGPDHLRGDAIGLQFRLGGVDQGRNRVEIHLFAGGYAGLVHLGDGTANLCMAVARDRAPHKPLIELTSSPSLAPNPFLRELLSRAELRADARSAFPLYFAPRRSYAERLLLVGDAAQVVEPVTGEGVYFALRSGLIAAETIEESFRHGDFTALRLGAYERRCRRAFRRRRTMNRLLQYLIYRPPLGECLIRFSSRRAHLLSGIVNSICASGPVGLSPQA